ncbi:hypothetical protein BGZ91_008493 [Linnemannia elongata]|nr:hypothetical protein BGZ91_008493 [Linnemannia elongata]
MTGSDEQKICGRNSTFVKQLDYIEAHIDLDEYHIWRENDEFFKSKKDERSNRDFLEHNKPYNAEKIVFPDNL